LQRKMPYITPAIKYLNIVIPAKAGIQEGTGCRIKSGMTELDYLIARLITTVCNSSAFIEPLLTGNLNCPKQIEELINQRIYRSIRKPPCRTELTFRRLVTYDSTPHYVINKMYEKYLKFKCNLSKYVKS